jgi:DNA processing protein
LQRTEHRATQIEEKQPKIVLSAEEQRVLNAFKEGAILDWSELLASTQMSMGELAMTMMELELKGAIRTLPGKRYEVI